MEATFQEARQRLGFETQRHWSEKAIRRSAPALLALFSVVTLFAHQHMAKGTRTPYGERPGTTRGIRPSPMLWRWYAKSYGPPSELFAGRLRTARRQKSRGSSWKG